MRWCEGTHSFLLYKGWSGHSWHLACTQTLKPTSKWNWQMKQSLHYQSNHVSTLLIDRRMMIDLKRVDIGVLRFNHGREVASGSATFVWVLNTHNKVSTACSKLDYYSYSIWSIFLWISWWCYVIPCCTLCWCLKSRDSFVPTSLEIQCAARFWREVTNIFDLFDKFFFLPKDTVIGIANYKEAKESVWDVDVQHKVQWIFLPHFTIIQLYWYIFAWKVVSINMGWRTFTVFESLSMTSLIVWTVGCAWGDAVSHVRFKSVPLDFKINSDQREHLNCWNHAVFHTYEISFVWNERWNKQGSCCKCSLSPNCQFKVAFFICS